DAAGVVRETGFCAAVIRSRARLDYPGVAAGLSGDFRGRREQYRKWAGTLERMNQLAVRLRDRRRERGTLELELPEPKVVLDADDPRLVRDVVRSKDSEAVRGAYQLVEEYMIAANEAVGAFFAGRGLISVWRVHAPPAEGRVRDLAALMESFGVEVDIEAARTPPGMRDVLEAIGDRPAARALSFLVLRSLKQAIYDTENIGHFGLASEEYLHFTSPIRRYPDLLVHRLLKYHLHREGQAAGGGGAYKPLARDELDQLARDSSSHERRAIEAERESVSMYRAYLMRDHVGEEFTGRVSGVQSFGVFIELDEPFVEGMIRLEALGGDSYELDDKHMRIRGRRSGFSLSLGDTVRVELVDVSVARRRVDFRLVQAGGE
ncbi:MAG TPA: RNB domain-containing ribonuclease, partial [Kofleriaceae bacterium]|nr:RNB domain-containing ribonuclease [Kofleriaceae bacterium]